MLHNWGTPEDRVRFLLKVEIRLFLYAILCGGLHEIASYPMAGKTILCIPPLKIGPHRSNQSPWQTEWICHV